MSDILRAIELAMHFAIVEARGNFRCNEVLYFNQVHGIANLLATSETDRTRVANLHWDFTSSRQGLQLHRVLRVDQPRHGAS
jgi:hypothetical protein